VSAATLIASGASIVEDAGLAALARVTSPSTSAEIAATTLGSCMLEKSALSCESGTVMPMSKRTTAAAAGRLGDGLDDGRSERDARGDDKDGDSMVLIDVDALIDAVELSEIVALMLFNTLGILAVLSDDLGVMVPMVPLRVLLATVVSE
jgi:hypothetical protein